MLTPDQQLTILQNIRAMVPDSQRSRAQARHSLMLGVILGLQSIDHNLVPPHWLMNVLAGRTDRLFTK